MTTTTSGRIPRLETKPRQKHAGRLSYLTAMHPARLPNPIPTTINEPDSRCERGTTGGQVKFWNGMLSPIAFQQQKKLKLQGVYQTSVLNLTLATFFL